MAKSPRSCRATCSPIAARRRSSGTGMATRRACATRSGSGRPPVHEGRHPAGTTTMTLSSLSTLRPLMAACLGFMLISTAHAFDLQAHRGGRGLQPENTLASFENATKMGVTTLELDIAITADGVAVISHEPALFPGTARDAEGHWLKETGPLIHSLTLAQLQRYDVGRLNPEHAYGKPFATQQAQDGLHIPTLASLFALARQLGADDVQFDIETKIYPNKPDDTVSPEEFVKTLLAVIRDAGMAERVMIQSFDWRTLQLVQRLAPGMRTVYLTIQSRGTNNVEDPSWTAGRLARDYPSVPDMI